MGAAAREHAQRFGADAYADRVERILLDAAAGSRVRIVFDSRPALDPRGIGRYATCLLTALYESAGRDDEIVQGHRPRRSDIYHAPWIDGALLRPPCPQVVTLHDVVPLKRRSEYLRSGIRFRMRYLAVERSARLIVPTAVVAQEVVEHLQDRARADHRHPRGARARAARARRRRRSPPRASATSCPTDYLLWVGGLQTPDPRKRIAALARAPRELPLVLVGATKPWAHELPDVTLTGRVSDDDLAAIYSGARALVFPSDDEGFGLPTVEALACGTPVVATDIPVLREVLGDRATFVAGRRPRGPARRPQRPLNARRPRRRPGLGPMRRGRRGRSTQTPAGTSSRCGARSGSGVTGLGVNSFSQSRRARSNASQSITAIAVAGVVVGLRNGLGPVGDLDLVVRAGLGLDGILFGIAIGVVGLGGPEPVSERSQRQHADDAEDHRDRREADAEEQAGDRARDGPGDTGAEWIRVLERAPDDLHQQPDHACGEDDERNCKGIHRRMSCVCWVVPPVIADSTLA